VQCFRCAICEKAILGGRHFICGDCGKLWGLVGKPYSEWPDWIKYLKNQEEKRRRRLRGRVHGRQGMAYTEISYSDEVYLQYALENR